MGREGKVVVFISQFQMVLSLVSRITIMNYKKETKLCTGTPGTWKRIVQNCTLDILKKSFCLLIVLFVSSSMFILRWYPGIYFIYKFKISRRSVKFHIEKIFECCDVMVSLVFLQLVLDSRCYG